jgi:excisionase family DNA binding protein
VGFEPTRRCTRNGRDRSSPLVREVAARVGVSLKTIQRWVRLGRLRAVLVGDQGRLRIPESELPRLPSIDYEAAA